MHQQRGADALCRIMPLGVVFAALLFAGGCANISRSTERVKNDLLVTVALPVQVVAGGAEDAYRSAADRPVLGAAAAPVVFAFSMYKHTLVSLVYAGDALLFPVYMWFGPKKLGIYDTSRFPFGQPETLLASRKRMSRDAAVVTTMPVAAPMAAGHDSATYIHAHPVKGWLVLPGVFTFNCFKHLQYGLVHAADLLLYSVYFPFSAKPLAIYNWEEYPFEVAPRFNRTRNRFIQSCGTFLSLPLSMWRRAWQSWKDYSEDHLVAGPVAPFYLGGAALYHAYLGTALGVDGLSYPLLFWTGWGPMDLYHPGDGRVNPMKASVVHHTSAAAILAAIGTGEITLGILFLADELRRKDTTEEDREGIGLWLIHHGSRTMALGVSQGRQAARLSDLARKAPSNYRCRTALEVMELALAENISEEAAGEAYNLGDRDELTQRSRKLVNQRFDDPISEAEGKAQQARARSHVRRWAGLVIKTAESLKRADEALDRRLARAVRKEILKKTGAITILPAEVGRIGTAAGAAERIRVVDDLLRVYHFPDDQVVLQKTLDDVSGILDSDTGDDVWYRRVRRELERLQIREYDRSGAHNVLRSLMSEGCVWLYETTQR